MGPGNLSWLHHPALWGLRPPIQGSLVPQGLECKSCKRSYLMGSLHRRAKGMQGLGRLPKVTQRVSGRAGTQTRPPGAPTGATFLASGQGAMTDTPP